MKKSAAVVLSAFFMATVASCVEQQEWVDGADEYGNTRDTVVDDVPYRYYRGSWYHIYNNQIRAPYYMQPRPVISQRPLRTGGFSHTASHSVVHS